MFPGLTRPAPASGQTSGDSPAAPPSYNALSSPPSYAFDLQQHNNGAGAGLGAAQAPQNAFDASNAFSSAPSYPNLAATPPKDSSYVQPPAYSTSSTYLAPKSGGDNFSKLSPIAAVSSPAAPTTPLQQNSSSSMFSQPMVSNSAPLALPSLDGSVIVASPAPVSAISSDKKVEAPTSPISAPPAYSHVEFGELFKQQPSSSNDTAPVPPMSLGAPQQPQQSAAASPIVVSPSPFTDINIPTPASLNLTPPAPKSSPQPDFVSPVQIGMFPSMQLPSSSTSPASAAPQPTAQPPTHQPPSSSSPAPAKLVLKSLDVTPLSDDEKTQIQQKLTALVSSGTSADRKILEAIIALISGGSAAHEVEVDIEKLDTPTLRKLQRIIAGDVEIVNKLSVRASAAQEAKQRFMNGVEEKLRKDTFDLVSDMLKTMGELSERVDELQARVEVLENEKREAQQTQQKLQADIKRLERSAAASTLNPPSSPASPSITPSSASALPAHLQRNSNNNGSNSGLLPTMLPAASIVPHQPGPQRSSPQSSSVFDLSQPPPAHAAPPKPAATASPKPPQQQPQAHPSPIMSAQPQVVYMAPPGAPTYTMAPGMAPANVQYVYPMGMQPGMIPITTTVQQNPQQQGAAPTLTYVPQYYSVQRP
eukprot:TRINITY_DN15445_c0_g1_i1.p1 TRINITY_DN15445_c0_g1~~TRINITY_DN15445_c0_g1_i1.p1  ORF type:complete len:647 (+),score=171.59 TRINITY_DN15445_c0_g1_i1:111-2051(+)